MWRSDWRFVHGKFLFQLGWLPVLGQDQQLGGGGGGVRHWESLFTSFAMEPKVFFVGDWIVCILATVSDGRLCTGNRGTKKEMAGSEGKVVLVIAGER